MCCQHAYSLLRLPTCQRLSPCLYLPIGLFQNGERRAWRRITSMRPVMRLLRPVQIRMALVVALAAGGNDIAVDCAATGMDRDQVIASQSQRMILRLQRRERLLAPIAKTALHPPCLLPQQAKLFRVSASRS